MVNIIVKTEYRDLFDGPVPTLDEVIPKKLDVNALAALSFMSHLRNYDPIVEWCINNLPLSKYQVGRCINTQLFKRPSNLMVWNTILSRELYVAPPNSFNHAMDFVVRALAVANECESQSDSDSFYMSEMVHYYRDDPLMQYFRASKILLNSSFISDDIRRFENLHNVSMSDYIKVCHVLNATYLDTSSVSWPLKVEKWAVDVARNAPILGMSIETMDRIMGMLALEHGESASEPYDYQKFSRKPYIKFEPYRYMPIDQKLAQDAVFNSVYSLLREASTDVAGFRSRYGFEFEKYVAELTQIPAKLPNIFKYKYIPEFTLSAGERKSSDSYITYFDNKIKKNITLVMEAKSARILNDVRRNGSNDAVLKSMHKLSARPFMQQISRTIDIVRECVAEITDEHVFYFVAVTPDNFPLAIGENDIHLSADLLKGLKSGGAFSMSIEEYELFIKLICSNIDEPFSYILEKYRVGYRYLSMKNYFSRLLKTYRSNEFHKMVVDSQALVLK